MNQYDITYLDSILHWEDLDIFPNPPMLVHHIYSCIRVQIDYMRKFSFIRYNRIIFWDVILLNTKICDSKFVRDLHGDLCICIKQE